MILRIHPETPQKRLVRQASGFLEEGKIGVCPTDCTYTLICSPDNKGGVQRIRDLRRLPSDHRFTLLCRDLSQISQFARVSNSDYRLLKSFTPGPFTFILQASRKVPNWLTSAKGNAIGVRICDHPVTLSLLEETGRPLLTSSLIVPGDELPMSEPDLIEEKLRKRVDFIIDSGPCGIDFSTVVDLMDAEPVVLRQGKGAFPVIP